MRFHIRDDADAVADYVAEYILQRVTEFNPTADRPFVLGLPTGSTPVKTYQRLIAFVKAGKLSFQNIVTFNMDEYVDLPPEHPQSYHYFMWDNLFNHVDVKRENVHILNGCADDLTEECEKYEQAIKAHGGIELFLGGIGSDGHIAFNEPGSSLKSRTRIKSLVEDTITANARFFGGDRSKVPKMALTMGVGTLLDSRELIIIATGSNKALALRMCVEEGLNHMWTVSCLQIHPKGMVVCDEDATLELRVKTVKYFKSIEEVLDENRNRLTRKRARTTSAQ